MAGFRGMLLRGASVAAIATVLASGSASAQTAAILRAVANVGNQATAAAVAKNPKLNNQPSPASQAQQTATLRALQYQANANSAVSLAEQAQEAARQAADALQSSVPDGLGAGGLDPVANPVTSDQDTNGLNTWQGASKPVQTTNGKQTDVTIRQTDTRAILDWQTFNVGKNTTLIFDQKKNGKPQQDWVALNRVVGQLDPTTGLRDPNQAPAPSQILGSIKADGTVLVLNQNGVIFSGTAQVDVHSLIATSLEIGRALDSNFDPLSIQQRNQEFLSFGLLGFADQASPVDKQSAFTFSAQAISSTASDPMLEGTVQVDAGATIKAGQNGFILLTGPKVINSGALSANQGQVSLESGREIVLTRSTGAAGGGDPNVRGFLVDSLDSTDSVGNYVENTDTGLIQSTRGYLSLGATQSGGVIDSGVLEATTSVSRNGFIQLSGRDIEISPDAVLAVNADTDKETIPQDMQSLADFKRSRIEIGGATSRIDIGANALVYAPGGDIAIGAGAGATSVPDKLNPGTSRIFIDSGAVIDAAGLKDVLIPASRNSIQISPVTQNDLRDTPNYKNSFLDGATVYVDPRISGVRADGVAWIGSPLIDAASYYQQVGVSAAELLTKGGNVTLGVASFSPRANTSQAPDVIIKQGATIDISGGYVRYQAGCVRTTQLIDASGHVIDISQADPNDTFVGIDNGYSQTQARWGVTSTWANPLISGIHYVGSYTEGRDAGTLTIKSSAVVLDGTVYAQAFPGPQQLANPVTGTGDSGIYGDERAVQAAGSQLPAGGFLFVQALGTDVTDPTTITGGGDISVVAGKDYTPVSQTLDYGQAIAIDSAGNLVVPKRDPDSILPADRQQTIELSSDALSGMGLGQLSLDTSGAVSVAKDASVDLASGGVFNAFAGRTITVDGAITAHSGAINLQTADLGLGSVFTPEPAGPGSFDVVLNGTLSTRGRWINDFGDTADAAKGPAYIDGGSISINAAPRVTLFDQTQTLSDAQKGKGPQTNVDISGSILLNKGSLIDVSGGGYVGPDGSIDTSAKGGNLSLIDQTTYFQLTGDNSRLPGAVQGWRVTTITDSSGNHLVPVNPDVINAKVSLGGTILANGFAGGGTFTLDTPQIAFGDGTATTGTELPMDFFSQAGFANYNITSYKTALTANTFDNGLGGYNAELVTQTLTVGAGQVLSLTQSLFSPVLDADQTEALRGLKTGGDLYSVLTPVVPPDAWDRRAVNLSLGGLIELHVAKGGAVTGDAGATLSVSGLYNEGTIRLVGGTIRQSEVLPSVYLGGSSLGVHDLAEAFSINADGTIDENAPNAAGISSNGVVLTNAQLAARVGIYGVADLDASQGVRLAKGSVTDLSGAVILNPRAPAQGVGNANQLVTGKIVAGGTLETMPEQALSGTLFDSSLGEGVYSTENPVGIVAPLDLDADAGAILDLSGAKGAFDEPDAGGNFVRTPVWSDGGTLELGNGGTLTGAIIDAKGGAADALGGTLSILDPVFYQSDPSTPTRNAISADMIAGAGFATLVAQGSINSAGDATIELSRGFFLESRPFAGGAVENLNNTAVRNTLAPVIGSTGTLEIDAPYIAFDSNLQTVSTPLAGTQGTGSAIFKADTIDVRGAVLFDQSVSNVQLDATGDVRLTGVQPWQLTFNAGDQSVPNSLLGQLAVNGDLTITAGQVYPTTGSTFYLTSSAADGQIAFAASGATAPATPYSAGGNLLVQADSIVQGGVVRVPLGTLTLGAGTPFDLTTDGATATFAPATQSVELTGGSTTSVSADGLVIPYGTTTDQTEWFFTPTGSTKLTAPPAAILHLGGANVSLDSGATVDIKGGGDLYAYEFIPGTGGSHDVLDQFNNDEFSSDNGYQYPDQRQVYAIVPGLSNAPAAAFDPIYSANYDALYSASDAGQRVYLSAAPGLAAGWYTLLPAKYALLPGGMRVVEDTSANAMIPGRSGKLKDGTLVVSGYYGNALSGTRESTAVTFDVQPQGVFKKFSNIAQTFANATFAALAAHNGEIVPRLPIDAGRLILNPAESLAIDTAVESDPANGGRGSEVDIAGNAFDIVSDLPAAPQSGTIYLTADSLSNLNASSLLIGGVRTENADGTTSLDITSNSIAVDNDAAHPLQAPEILLAVDGSASSISLSDSATILAKGTITESSGDYVIDGSVGGMTGQGAFLRVSSGPQRLFERLNVDKGTDNSALTIGQADIEGNSVLLGATGAFTIDSSAKVEATDLALAAGNVSFAPSAAGISGLVITPVLQTLFAKADELTILTPNVVSFAGGTYQFGNLDLDSPGIALSSGNHLTLQAGVLTLDNGSAAAPACGAAAPTACGTGKLAIDADSIVFGDGTVQTYGFGGGVKLSAKNGMFVEGDGAFDAGPAPLSLVTPFLGDELVPVEPGADLAIPSLVLSTTGDVSIAAPAGSSFDASKIAGVPGAGLTIEGDAITIADATLRATAGQLKIDAAKGIAVSGAAVIETPSYARTFGDSADPVKVSAPGGTLTLSAQTGDISLGAGTTLSVGGKDGAAGTLALEAASGTIAFDGALDGKAPDGGGSLLIDTGGSFALADLNTLAGNGFTGNIDIHTRQGDLSLAADQTIVAKNLQLTADGGLVDIAGTINVSGVNGGDVGLYGADGVTLAGSAMIDAHAQGYARNDTRQAAGGTVEIGTDGKGKIGVASGAVIDVSATRTQARLVPLERNGTTYYAYVPGDQGGTVHFRAPVSGPDGAETVNINFGGKIDGASSVVVEGFKRFDLATVASDPHFVGVTINSDGQAVLDTGAAGSGGQVNFLTDNAAGTVVSFVQNFDISKSYKALGGLSSQANFHADPGMELDYSGDIVLASNWNLGAGSVNVAGAVAAGLMAPYPGASGKYYVIPGKEADVFERFTSLTYRTGGSVEGEPGILTLRAGGTLDINASISDGFFAFGDQTDPDYLNAALGGGTKIYSPWLSDGCIGSCDTVGGFHTGGQPSSFVVINIPSAFGLQGILDNPVPYSAAANAPDAKGGLAGGSGDPLGSAVLFPLLQGAGGPAKAVNSWSYRLVGGADGASANPVSTLATAANGDVVVEGTQSYTYKATNGKSQFNTNLLLQAGTQFVSASQWLAAMLAANPGLNPDSYTSVSLVNAPASIRTFMAQHAQSFFKNEKGNYQLVTQGGSLVAIHTTLALASSFISEAFAQNFSKLKSAFHPPQPFPVFSPTTATTRTLVRTGTGDISVAAAGNIDLRNGATPTYRDFQGNITTPAGGLQVGGTAIYTAGTTADLTPVTITDSLTGLTREIDPTAYENTNNFFVSGLANGYQYGGGGFPSSFGVGYKGILIVNPVYASGGGDVSLDAGGNVLGRRDIFQEGLLNQFYDQTYSYGYTWIGTADQPWRSGQVGAVTNIQIDPQLFQSGVATLGGGNVSVHAGGDVSDLTVVADTSVVTADVRQSSGAAPLTQALWTTGGGNVVVDAGNDVLGGRFDVASGAGLVAAGAQILGDGTITTTFDGQKAENDLRLRVTDATVTVQADQGVTVQGIASLGVMQTNTQDTNNLDARGFYSDHAGISITADGDVSVLNTGADVVTPSEVSTGYTSSAIYPGSFEAASLDGGLTLKTAPATFNVADAILLYPSPIGELQLYSGASIEPTTIAMEDADPGILPGAFSSFTADFIEGVLTGQTFLFPAILSSTTQVQRSQLHNQDITHKGDTNPNRIYAAGDILDMILSVPKQTRIGAGQDIINMMFFGQNVSPNDITRITAGRDIVGTTDLERPLLALPSTLGDPLATLQGNTFVIGGPGAFFLEAGRDAGPFLNSAETNGFENVGSSTVPAGTLTYGGGIISVGNDWNPWLPDHGSSLYVEFGVGKGADFNGFRNYYLDPANLPNLDDSLFVQVKDSSGNLVADRTQPIYAPILIKWMQQNAAADLRHAYGTTKVTYQQAYDAFKKLPELRQREFILSDVYFNELEQTAIPTSPSFKQYSRGYRAVNMLFPAKLGYTQNDLSGGSNGANKLVETGNLDLRLATIQTQRGGNIYLLGPGGRVLAGSTVATADQAARHAFNGGSLFSGNINNEPLPSAILDIPLGYEGVLSLRGGSIDTFTDQDFLLNQSRLFTEAGGDIAMWSSNGDLNAGQGPKTSANFPPVVVRLDEDLYSQLDSVGGVTGAGIAAFETNPNEAPPDVFLIAPRGTVDAGSAGVRVAGNLFVAALTVANAANFSVGGAAFGIPIGAAVDVGALTSASASATAAAQAAQSAMSSSNARNDESVITVEVLGYAGGEQQPDCNGKDKNAPECKKGQQ